MLTVFYGCNSLIKKHYAVLLTRVNFLQTSIMYYILIRSEAEEDPIPPPLTPAPSAKPAQVRKPPEKPIQSKPMPTIVPSFAFPTVQQQNQPNVAAARAGTMPSIPVPLLILNSLQPQQTPLNNVSQEKKDAVSSSNNGSTASQNGKGKSCFRRKRFLWCWGLMWPFGT